MGLKRDSEQAFSSEFCEIFTNIYFEDHLRTAASKMWVIRQDYKLLEDFREREYSIFQIKQQLKDFASNNQYDEKIEKLLSRSTHWKVFYKRVVLFCQASILWTLVYLFWTKKSFSQETNFSQVLLSLIKNSFILYSQIFRCSRARNKLRTGALQGIQLFNRATRFTRSL